MRIVPQRRGVATIWFAIVGLALVALFGLALETVRYYFSFQQLQAAADASALSALDYLPKDVPSSRAQAIKIANSNACADLPGVTLVDNPSNAYGGDIVYGFYDIQNDTFTRTTTNANAAKITAQRTDSAHGGVVKFIFTGLASQSGSSQVATATAFLTGPQPGLLLLDKDGKNQKDALTMQGGANTALAVNNGSILVNSNNAEAADIHGTISADTLATVGGVSSASNTTLPTQVKLTQPVPDPVAPFVPPLSPSQYGPIQTGTTDPLQPGWYQNGLPAGNHQLAPGTYVLGGNWMPLASSYSGTGVTLYLLKPTGTPNFDPMNITAPTTGQFADVAVYQDPTPGSFVSLSYTGTPNFNITGTVYMPYTDITVNGNTTISAFGSEVILNTLNLKGSASFTMNAIPYFQVIGTQRTLINTQRTVFQ